jgi:hypothetical protein
MKHTLFPRYEGHADPIFGLGYAGLIAISTLRGYFHLVELPWFATQFAYIAVLGLGFAWIFVTGNTKRLNLSLNVMLFQMIPNFIILVWSVGLWVYRQEPLSLIMRGSSLVVYQLLLLAMLISAGAMFGKQAIEYTAMGFILANSLILLDVMRRMGVGSTITGMMQFLMSVGSNDNAISVNLEVQDVTFGIGILLVYYLVDGQDEHWRWFYVAALTFYLFMGFKRILFPAIALAVAYCFLMKRLRPRSQIALTVTIGLVLIAISLGYVVLIRTGLWFDICDRFGIDLMGRKRLYGYMESYYTISPSYMGMGNGMVSTVLEVLETTGNRRLHSDVLRMYIELGMPSFLLWCVVTFILTYTFFARNYSLAPARIYFAITLLMYVTFLTDNTLEKYCPEIAWHVLPLGIILAEREQMAAALRRNDVLSSESSEPSERSSSWRKPKKEKTPPAGASILNPSSEEEAVAEKLRKFRLKTQSREDS